MWPQGTEHVVVKCFSNIHKIYTCCFFFFSLVDLMQKCHNKTYITYHRQKYDIHKFQICLARMKNGVYLKSPNHQSIS